ncbi:zinc finger protein, putative [Ricinus communis]|uniref:Zinc finger protein, putative n=1 Tax=Ricinus communis TaxID=3988 RepID=B9T6Q1_RICCO|nr:zinc finger protein, putative [Ricinus communis]
MVIAMSNLISLRFPVLILLLSLLVASSNVDYRLSNKLPALFVFGDSVFDPGNNNFRNVTIDFKADFWPFGETFFNLSTGRFTDGRIVPDFLSMYLNVPLWKPYLAPGTQNLLHGANFAGGGAAALDEYSYSGTIPFSEQLRFFEEVASFLKQQLSDEEAMKILKEAVYLSSLGGIDYLTFTGTYLNATEAEIEEFINMVVGNITDGVKKIYAIGGRKFAFQNVGPLGCMPIVRKLFGLTNDSCYEDLLYIASLHNDALANATKELESQLPGFKYLIYDYYSLLLQRIENPSDYGFIEGVSACCGNGTYLGSGCGIEPYELCSDPSEFVWFDGGHPTEHTNAQLARLVWEGGPDASTPYNLKQLYDLEVSDEISSSE